MYTYTITSSAKNKYNGIKVNTTENTNTLNISITYSLPPNPQSTFYPFINVVIDTNSNIGSDNLHYHWVITNEQPQLNTQKSHNYPLFYAQQNIIRIPKKCKYAVMNLIPKMKLKRIHPDILVAQELCFLFLSQLSSTYYKFVDGSDLKGWKSLYSPYLRSLTHVKDNSYILVREALETYPKNDPMIECDHNCILGAKSYNYRLGSAFLGKGIDSYELQTEVCCNLYKKKNESLLANVESNTIYQNLLQFYSSITLPNIDEIKYYAIELTKQGYTSKKGKELKFLNKHPKSYYKNPNKLTFVEDGIEIYKSLTEGGLIIPHIGDEKSGGRVTDSINLMPSWIRQLIKIEGTPLVECDFSCFHPNIAMTLYNGGAEYITHQEVAEKANIDITIVKTEHLSFFNRHPKDMEKSPLFEYYYSNENEMMKKIIKEKYESKNKYKRTSMRMFKTEVEIITEAIKVINQNNIFVGYIYDAILCHPKDLEIVKGAMLLATSKYGIKSVPK